MGLIILRAIGVTGICLVIQHHIEMAWWEGGLLSFSIMMLLGTLFDIK
jgi:hypothetical protein